jgi:SAM-dependent methyltransferase
MRYYDSENSRLVYLGQSPNSDFWDNKWQADEAIRDRIMGVRSTYVSRITKRYIQPQDGLVIEGGCGLGQHVAALTNSGYQCLGVDSAEQTVSVLARTIPELDIRLGDVRHLDFDDGAFVGYWSLGVIEHFWDGYQDLGLEVARVLRPGGYLFVTFPYMSPLRRVKAFLRCYLLWQEDGVPASFYQFALDHRRVVDDFREWGFELVRARSLDGLKGTKDEIVSLKRWLQSLYDYRGASWSIRGFRAILSSALALVAGHSMLLVLRRRHLAG